MHFQTKGAETRLKQRFQECIFLGIASGLHYDEYAQMGFM